MSLCGASCSSTNSNTITPKYRERQLRHWQSWSESHDATTKLKFVTHEHIPACHLKF